jgi:Sec-independent protein translocase protein TatA
MGGFNIFGIGPWQILIIFTIMLVVAGPKRMVEWAYQAGRYAAMLRSMMQETMNAVHKEIEASGLDIRKDIASALPAVQTFDVLGEAAKVINSEPTTSANTTSAASPANPSANAPQINSDGKDNDDKPRYDSWLPG